MADIKKLTAWLKAGEALLGSPIVRGLASKIAIDLRLSDADRAQLDANFADGRARRDRAQAAADVSSEG